MIIEKEDLLEYQVEIAKVILDYHIHIHNIIVNKVFLAQVSSSTYEFVLEYQSLGYNRRFIHSNYIVQTQELIVEPLSVSNSYVKKMEKSILSAIKTAKRDKIINELV